MKTQTQHTHVQNCFVTESETSGFVTSEVNCKIVRVVKLTETYFTSGMNTHQFAVTLLNCVVSNSCCTVYSELEGV
jgi:adenine-specific DNA methylase